MADKNYEIKMDGKEHKFGEATRYTKDGKGRFDLIPSDVMAKVIEYIYKGAPHDTDVSRRALKNMARGIVRKVFRNGASRILVFVICVSILMVRMTKIISLHQYGISGWLNGLYLITRKDVSDIKLR